MKKILCLSLLVVFALVLAGCNKEKKVMEKDNMDNVKLKLIINEKVLIATLEDNVAVKELVSKLRENKIEIDMDDYAKQEKVGNLGFSLTRCDEDISVDYGDLILYQGNSFVIYYEKNNWSLTKLGHIDNISKEELKEILGKESVKVVLELEEKSE